MSYDRRQTIRHEDELFCEEDNKTATEEAHDAARALSTLIICITVAVLFWLG